MSEVVTKSDFRELKSDILRSIEGVTEKLEEHLKEDVKVQGETAVALANLTSRVNTVTGGGRMALHLVLTLVGMAIAATVGFVVRSSVDVQTARPIQQEFHR